MRNEQEVRQIYEQYGNDLYRLCCFYTNNVQDALDAVQNTLVKLLEYQGGFESEQHKKGWLLKVGVNECRQLQRLWWRRNVSLVEEVPEYAAYQAGLEGSELLSCVMALPKKYRVPLYMYYYEGYSAAEIGQILGKKEVTVRSLLLRARKQLKGGLEGKPIMPKKEEGKAVS